MADSDYPVLVFPEPVPADRAKLFGGGGTLRRPGVARQVERLAPQFQRLLDALENRRIAIQDSSLGIEPELALVLKTVGPPADFFRAVEKVEGLEWLAEYSVEDIPPGDGFEDANNPEKSLSGRLFLIMSDGRALTELERLFNSWHRDSEAPFSRGLAPFKKVFEHLREIRPWDMEDRLADTGLLDDWREQEKSGQDTVSFEGSWANLVKTQFSFHSGGEVQASEMEVNGGCKSFIISESAGAYFDCFYSAVDAFGRAIADLENNCIDDSPQVVFNGFGGFLDRLQAAAHGPGKPSFPALAGPGGMYIMP